jgi:ketosteroid isomerase-like protein
MNEQNVALVQGMYDAFGRGDVPAVLGAMDDNIEWYEAEGLPYGGLYNSPQAVAENVFGRVIEDVEGFTVTPEEFFTGGDEVVVIARYTGTGAATGKSLDVPVVHALTVRDGKVARFRQFMDTVKFNEVLAVEASV